PRALEVRAQLLGDKGLRLSQTGSFEQARAVFVEAVALHPETWSADPEERRRSTPKLAQHMLSGAKRAARPGKWDDAQRESWAAADMLERLRAGNRDDGEIGVQLADIEMSLGQGHQRRGEFVEGKAILEVAVAHIEALAAREPKNSRYAYVRA